MHTPFTPWMNFLHVQTICITDLYDYVNPYSVIILYVCTLSTCSTSYCLVTPSGICGMYMCMYVCTTSYFISVVISTITLESCSDISKCVVFKETRACVGIHTKFQNCTGTTPFGFICILSFEGVINTLNTQSNH